MKKIIFILILFISCYSIYYLTIDHKSYYLTIGNSLSLEKEDYSLYIKDYLDNQNKLKGYNNNFINQDNRITDLYYMIKNNEKIIVENHEITINQLLKKADIITLSIGMNELYYKLLLNDDNIYTYINGMLLDTEKLLKEINRYNHQKVFILGYYNITNNHQDIFNYLNYKLKQVTKKEGFDYVDLDKIITKNNVRNNDFNLNKQEYYQISQIIVDKIKKT